MAAVTCSEWYNSGPPIQGWLCDITGVLYDSGEVPIPGSAEAINRLKEAGVPIRLCTNETQCVRRDCAAKLSRLGFNVRPEEIYPPSPAVCQIIREQGLGPFLLVHPGIQSEFKEIDTSNPNCVVIGDSVDQFSYDNLNKAFNILVSGRNPLLTMGTAKYFKEVDGPRLNVGAYIALLQFATDCSVQIAGKPNPRFFQQAAADMGVLPENTVMIGDDIIIDIQGAKAGGIRGIQVRTGKYRSEDEPHHTVTPDGYVDNLFMAVDLFLKNR